VDWQVFVLGTQQLAQRQSGQRRQVCGKVTQAIAPLRLWRKSRVVLVLQAEDGQACHAIKGKRVIADEGQMPGQGLRRCPPFPKVGQTRK